MFTHIETARGRIEIGDDMIVDYDDWIPAGEYNPHNVRPWVIGGEFGALAIVFASNETDAFDSAIDGGKLDGYQIHDHECDDECEALHGGNASEPFDQTYLWIEPIDNPPASFVAALMATL